MLSHLSFSAFIYGLPVGFVFSFALGPVFFSLIKTSLERGIKAAVSIAVGVVVADMLLLAIAYGCVDAFLPKTNVDVTFWVQILGGLLLLSLGIATVFKKPQNTEGSLLTEEKYIIKHLSTGFFLNLLNPANFFEWMGAASLLKSKYHFNNFENISFFTGALLAVFFTELSVAYFATRLRHILAERVMHRINLVIGVVFIGSGIWFLGAAL
ncbi:MAG: LysE family transporter [Saprospiraceae bacterium]|nr:LysE family transporter [Saprospiraceae bacterium]